jgi:glycerol-3-phosphate acyltransferase PlsY
MHTLSCCLLGYLLGSILFARVAGALFHRDITGGSPDRNPGTANAFTYGGFWCGLLTLCGDLAKGFLPVFFYLHFGGSRGMGLALVLAAPVLGHLFPLFTGFRGGGKGIAVSFGCLLGLAPDLRPALVLAAVFLFFSLVVRVSPHYHRTLITYLVSSVAMRVLIPARAVVAGFFLIAGAIVGRLLCSTEEKPHCQLEVVWKR